MVFIWQTTASALFRPVSFIYKNRLNMIVVQSITNAQKRIKYM